MTTKAYSGLIQALFNINRRLRDTIDAQQTEIRQLNLTIDLLSAQVEKYQGVNKS